MQPPLRGCVLKLSISVTDNRGEQYAAASARLCVETPMSMSTLSNVGAAASARLCVETPDEIPVMKRDYAAASARLCVETIKTVQNQKRWKQPPLRGCVLKLLR